MRRQIYGLEYEVECLAASQRDKGQIMKRLLAINQQIIPCTSDRAERIYQKLARLFQKLTT